MSVRLCAADAIDIASMLEAMWDRLQDSRLVGDEPVDVLDAKERRVVELARDLSQQAGMEPPEWVRCFDRYNAVEVGDA